MVDAFTELLKVDTDLVRKWGRPLIAVQDYSEPIPSAFFDEDGLPVLPASAKQLGFITTDGTTNGKSISTTPTNMAQWTDPVRQDLESVTKTLACAFGEASNAWVNAVYEGLTVADFPAAARAPWIFDDDDEPANFPAYRLWAIYADGVGDQAFYRVEYGYKARVTSTTDRSMTRANPETLGFTFSYERDTASGKALTRTENGPGFTAGAPTTP